MGGPHSAQPLTEGGGRPPGSVLSADVCVASEAGSPGWTEPGTALADCSSPRTDLFQKHMCSGTATWPSSCSGSQQTYQLRKPELSHLHSPAGDLRQQFKGSGLEFLPPCVLGPAHPAPGKLWGSNQTIIKVKHLFRLLSHQGNANCAS